MAEHSTVPPPLPSRLADELAIRAVAERYTDAVNHRDWAAYRACWIGVPVAAEPKVH